MYLCIENKISMKQVGDMKLYNFEDLLDEDYSIAWRDPCALSAKRNITGSVP